MAVTLQCPRCEYEQQIDDDQIGKEVPCKICHHLIQTSNAGDGIKVGKPTSAAGARSRPSKQEDEEPRAKKSRWSDDDDDDQRSLPRRRRAKEDSSSTLLWIFLGLGGAAVLISACGGVGFVLLVAIGVQEEARIQRDEAVAMAAEDAAIVAEVAQANQPMPGFPNPPQPAPFGNPNPPLELLDPNNRNNIDRVVAILKGPANEHVVALTWLRDSDPNHPRRAEVARLLEGLVDNELRMPRFGVSPFFPAYFRWVTKDNVPSLLRLAENNALNGADNDRRHKAMLALAQMKEPRAVPILAAKLGNHFDADVPQNALREMGPMAEKAVLQSINHPDSRVRDQARALIQGYKTQPSLILTQCIVDLDAGDKVRRNAAVQWFATNPAVADRRAEVAQALGKNLATVNFFFEKDLAKALADWGTSDNVPALIQRIEANKTGNDDAIRILGKIRDPNGIKAIARSMVNFFNDRAAKEALKEIGPKLAEPAVIEAMTATNDMQARARYIAFLGEFGTSARSGPAFMQLAVQFPQDFFLNNAIKKARAAIQARGQ